jgi:hypothetical protein
LEKTQAHPAWNVNILRQELLAALRHSSAKNSSRFKPRHSWCAQVSLSEIYRHALSFLPSVRRATKEILVGCLYGFTVRSLWAQLNPAKKTDLLPVPRNLAIQLKQGNLAEREGSLQLDSLD